MCMEVVYCLYLTLQLIRLCNLKLSGNYFVFCMLGNLEAQMEKIASLAIYKKNYRVT
jgi:hypothetical protein